MLYLFKGPWHSLPLSELHIASPACIITLNRPSWRSGPETAQRETIPHDATLETRDTIVISELAQEVESAKRTIGRVISPKREK